MCTANGYHVPELPGLVQRPNAHSSQPNRSPEVHLNYDGRFAAPRGRGLVCRRRVPPAGHNPPRERSRPSLYSTLVRGLQTSNCNVDFRIATAVFNSCAASAMNFCSRLNARLRLARVESSASTSGASSRIFRAVAGGLEFQLRAETLLASAASSTSKA